MAHALGHLRSLAGQRARARFGFGLRALARASALACGWLAIAGTMGHAQAAASARFVRFTVFSARPVASVAFTPRAGATPQTLVFYPTARSPRYEFRGVMPLRFVDAETGEVVAEATIPPQIREALLLFSPVEDGAAMPVAAGTGRRLRYKIAVLDDSALRLTPGGLAIVNLSGLALNGTVNDAVVTLRAGLNPTVKIGRTAKIRLRTSFKKRMYEAYAATVPLSARQRALLILFPPFYRGSLEVQSRLLIDEPAAPRRD